MKRNDFLKLCSILGLSAPFYSIIASCTESDQVPAVNVGRVIIIGAGPAGLTAAYLLAQKGIDCTILEAGSSHGGRLLTNNSFADFPIPLGAEWLHTSANELTDIVNDTNVQVDTALAPYEVTDQIGHYENGNLTYYPIFDAFGNDFDDKKFVNASWLDFFDQHIVPRVVDKIILETPVVSIDYRGEAIQIIDSAGGNYVADKLIVTAPLSVLQHNDIGFTPALPQPHQDAITNAPIWGGIKVFIEFSAAFYPAYLTFTDSDTADGQRVYYDASHGHTTTKYILGLLALGEQALAYQSLTGNALRDYILAELDAVFNGVASASYVGHVVHNWDESPFIKGAYLSGHADVAISSTLAQSVGGKLFFAGDAYTQEDDWGGVHNAVRSAADAVDDLLASSD